MDPANYQDYNLPKIDYHQLKRSKTFYEGDYEEFDGMFHDYASYCQAITYDDEVVFNKYKSRSFREDILEESVRHNVMNISLLTRLVNKGLASRVILYMSVTTPWFVACYYNPEFRIVTVEFYTSKKYKAQS